MQVSYHKLHHDTVLYMHFPFLSTFAYIIHVHVHCTCIRVMANVGVRFPLTGGEQFIDITLPSWIDKLTLSLSLSLSLSLCLALSLSHFSWFLCLFSCVTVSMRPQAMSCGVAVSVFVFVMNKHTACGEVVVTGMCARSHSGHVNT